MALELERTGHVARVNDGGKIMLDACRTIKPQSLGASTSLVRWVLVAKNVDVTSSKRWPLAIDGQVEATVPPCVDPAVEPDIIFSKAGNFRQFALFGWSDADSMWTWSEQREVLLVVRPLPLISEVSGVDLVINATSGFLPERIGLQSMTVQFNGASVETVVLPVPSPEVKPVVVRIKASLWNEAAAKKEARILFGFPNAASPIQLGLGTDRRFIGGSFREIKLQPVVSTDAD